MNNFSLNRYFVLSIGVVLLITSFGYSQDKLRIIQDVEHESSPVVVVSRHVGDRTFDRSHQNRHGITAGNNWLSEFSLDVKNVSNKNVTYINLHLDIPKWGKMKEIGRTFPIFSEAE